MTTMTPLPLEELRAAADLVHAVLPPTPQYRWSLLEQALPACAEVWVKHENHTPLGAFKVRGGLVYVDRLLRSGARPSGLVSATRGNHGQSMGFAARRAGLPVTIFVPHGNSREKNAAMRALGVELVEHGDDFQAAAEASARHADTHGGHRVPSYHRDLVAGVASYALELFDAAGPLDTVYVPIGMGSGASGLVAARDALGLSTRIVGVVSAHAPAYALSLAAGHVVTHPAGTALADGMACSTPDPVALSVLSAGLADIVRVSDDEVAAAMRLLFETTHQVAEGAGAAALAGAWQQHERLGGQRVGLILSGGNIDREAYARVIGASS